jgi:hypothetical protein
MNELDTSTTRRGCCGSRLARLREDYFEFDIVDKRQ